MDLFPFEVGHMVAKLAAVGLFHDPLRLTVSSFVSPFIFSTPADKRQTLEKIKKCLDWII